MWYILSRVTVLALFVGSLKLTRRPHGLVVGVVHAPGQQCGRDRGVDQRLGWPALHQQDEVQAGGGYSEVHPFVQLLPSGRAQPLDHRRVGRDRERDQDRKRDHADRDVRTLQQVFPDRGEVQILVEPDVDDDVEKNIEKRDQADGAAVAHQI